MIFPAGVKLNWRREIGLVEDEAGVQVLQGKDAYDFVAALLEQKARTIGVLEVQAADRATSSTRSSKPRSAARPRAPPRQTRTRQ